jgi:hypothetical protein
MRLLVLLATAVLLAACSDPAPEHRADWVLKSRIVFEGEPLPPSEYRLWFPYVIGDFYGAPDTVDFIKPTLQSDGTVAVDLNIGHDQLLAALEPAEFGVSLMKIEPADARIARLTPMAMQADGIEQVGSTQWIDADSKQPVMLVYADRPCRIFGGPFDIRIAGAGYVWVGETAGEDGKATYATTSQPARLALEITPERRAALPGNTRPRQP